MQIFSRISIFLTVFNQIRLKNYQIKTNQIFNFSHKISQKRHFVAQKRLFLYEIHDIFLYPSGKLSIADMISSY